MTILETLGGPSGRRQGAHALLLAVCGILVMTSTARPAAAQEMDLPVTIQWSVLDRVLVFDRSFSARTDDGIVVGVLYQSGYRPSLLAHNDVLAAAADSDGRLLAGEELRLVSIEAATGEALRERLSREGVDLLYVAPLRAYDLRELSSLTAGMSIPTFTGVRDYVLGGLGLGVGQRGGRPEILVNLRVARAQGMDLEAQFLRLVTVVTAERGDDGDPPAG